MTVDGEFARFAVYTSGAVNNSPDSTTNIDDGKWHFWTGTYDGTNLSIWVDGVQEGTPTALVDATLTSTTNILNIGGFCNGNLTTQIGTFDEVRIYNRALSSSEIKALYNSGAVKFTTSSANLQVGSSLEKGLVGLWTFDGADVTDKIYDRSGQSNHGYFTGNATSAAKSIGQLGQALQFNGDTLVTSVRVLNESNFDFTASQPFSVAGWVYQISDAYGGYIAQKTNGAGTSGWGVTLGAGNERNIYFFLIAGAAILQVHSPVSSIQFGRWQHVVVTTNGNGLVSGVSIYVDGVSQSVLTDSDTLGGGSIVNNVDVRLGLNYALNAALHGKLDDVRVYNRALTPAEVKQLYQLGTVIIGP